MTRVKICRNGEVYVIDNGSVCHFDHGGRCIEENIQVTDQIMTGMVDLPIVSVLSSKGNVSVAKFHGETFDEKMVDMDAMTVAMLIQRNGGYVRMLRRDGVDCNIRFNQMLFVYAEGTNLDSKLIGLKFKEG